MKFSLTPLMAKNREKILNDSTPASARRISLLALIDLMKAEIDSRDDRIKDLEFEREKAFEALEVEVQRNMDLELKRILASEGMV